MRYGASAFRRWVILRGTLWKYHSMPLKSMTGFARSAGALAQWRWSWEIKAVNARGLDLRVRAPPGFDALEAEARARLGAQLARGTCYATLSGQREQAAPEIRVNENALKALAAVLERLPASDFIKPASLDGLLAIRGIVEIVEAPDTPEVLAEISRAMLINLDQAVQALIGMRAQEGEALKRVLTGQLERLTALTKAANDNPGRKPEAVRARLQQMVQDLTHASTALDPQRLHQEAVMLAAKADVREEIDRLSAHLVAAAELVDLGGPAGRRLDFLAQEMAREANTLCSKSNDKDLTNIGMEMRALVEQFREQVQNIE